VSDLLQRENVSVDVERGVVLFKVGKYNATFHYVTAFQIAQRLRLAANVAGRAAGIPGAERGQQKRQVIGADHFAGSKLSEDGRLEGGAKWDVWSEGALVVFQVADLIAKWEAPAAMEIAAWFREAGRRGKRWAGDTSRTISVAGTLTDANANARLNQR
jgi:hypothetical protein